MFKFHYLYVTKFTPIIINHKIKIYNSLIYLKIYRYFEFIFSIIPSEKLYSLIIGVYPTLTDAQNATKCFFSLLIIKCWH